MKKLCFFVLTIFVSYNVYCQTYLLKYTLFKDSPFTFENVQWNKVGESVICEYSEKNILINIQKPEHTITLKVINKINPKINYNNNFILLGSFFCKDEKHEKTCDLYIFKVTNSNDIVLFTVYDIEQSIYQKEIIMAYWLAKVN